MVLFQCYFAGFGLYYLVTAAFQVENQKGADILFIFQNQILRFIVISSCTFSAYW